jgi:prepilin-type N-terminal cleavage/methylation domain-containing protein/prepilin-type processing-associated H-X9-DG protein
MNQQDHGPSDGLPIRPMPGTEIYDAMARKAFTLIELLVVISIIALLVGILLPALGAARESAKNMVCKAKLKQVAIAHELWLEDSNRKALYRVAVGNRWPVLLIERYPSEIASPGENGNLEDSTLICPNDTEPAKPGSGDGLGDYAAFTVEVGGSYFLNNDVNAYGPAKVATGINNARIAGNWATIANEKGSDAIELWSGDSIDIVKATSSYSLFWDSSGHRDVNGETFTNGKPHRWWYSGGDEPLENYTPDPERHRGTGNILYLDSHVDSKSLQEIDYDIVRWDNVNEVRE